MPKILVIDDEEQICEIVCDLMESEGYEVDSANDGESGLEKLKNDKFDLIFLDILMPGTDGLQILQQVQAIQKVPTIIMSGYIPPGMEDSDTGLNRLSGVWNSPVYILRNLKRKVHYYLFFREYQKMMARLFSKPFSKYSFMIRFQRS